MRRLIVTENSSLDGIIAPMDGWFDPAAADADVTAANQEHRDAADGLLLGRQTYQDLYGFWPHQHDDRTGISDYLNQVPKYVLSRTLVTADWENTTVLRGDLAEEVAALKAQSGDDIVVTGSVSVVQALAPTGLVDLYRLWIYPAVQGYGRRLFTDGVQTGLKLTDSRTFASGVVLLEYRPTGGAHV